MKPEMAKAVSFARVTLTPKAAAARSLSRNAWSTRPVRLWRNPVTASAERTSTTSAR